MPGVEAALENGPVSASTACLPITNPEADGRFRATALGMSLCPEDLWVGRYVDYEWRHSRHILQNIAGSLRHQHVLEFGCNIGATAIVLAALGAKVTAIDVSLDYIRLARLNAERYGFEKAIQFVQVMETGRLPFEDEIFDLVCCNSVLEYVRYQFLPRVQKEIDRVLRREGIVAVLGTSNRVWPREVHSKTWLINYLPRWADALLPGKRGRRRGVYPWQIRYGFGNYRDLGVYDGGRSLVQAKALIGSSPRKLQVVSLSGKCLRLFSMSIGMWTPNICLILKKR